MYSQNSDGCEALLYQPRALFIGLLILVSTILSSCGIGIFTRQVFGETLDIEVSVEETANNEFPLAMDVVYVYDDELFRTLLQMTAREWFDRKEELQSGKEAEDFESWSWEWSPGLDTTVHIPLRGSVAGAVIFANYFSNGQHRIRVEPFRDLRVDFDFAEMKAIPL